MRINIVLTLSECHHLPQVKILYGENHPQKAIDFDSYFTHNIGVPHQSQSHAPI